MVTNRLVEFRVYRLRSGTRQQFHELVQRHSIPMLAEASMDVVAYGPSENDADGYFLFRSYENQADLQATQQAFYSSEAWINGPRESIISLIESHESVTIWLTVEAIELMKRRI